MANTLTTFSLTDKLQSSEFDLLPGDGTKKLLLDTISLSERSAPAAWYTAEDGKTKLLRYANGDRGAYFEVIVDESTQLTSDNTLTKLRRWCRRAIEAEYDPRNNRPIYLKVELTGASEATYHRIKYAQLDESRSAISPYSVDAWRVGVSLVLYPTGTTGSPINLSTLVANGDLSYWNSAGAVPDDWTLVNSGTARRVGDYALVGPHSCELTASASNDGIECDSAYVPVNHLVIGQAWVSVSSGSFRVQLRNNSSGDNLDQVTGITSANLSTKAEITAVDDFGHTWGLIEVTQSVTAVYDDVQIRVKSDDGAGVCYIDGVTIRSVEESSLLPFPGMDVTNTFVWVDGWAVSGYLETGQSDGNTVAGTDASNRYMGAKGATVTFATTSNADGYYRCLTLAQDRQSRVFSTGFWIRFQSDGGTDLKIDLRDGAGNVLDTVTIDSSNIASEADQSDTGADLATWYNFKLNGTNSEAPGVYLYFAPTATGISDMNFYLDQVFIYEGTGPSTGHYAQMFSPNLDSDRAGYFGTSVINDANLNWVRFYNLPGDEPALVEIVKHSGGRTVSDAQIWLSKFEERRFPEIEVDIQTAEFTKTAVTDGAWTSPDPTVTGASGSTAARFVTSGADAEGYLAYSIVPHPAHFPTGNLLRWAAVERRVKVRAKADDVTGVTFQFKLVTNVNASSPTFNSWQSAEELLTTDDTWEEIDLGALFLDYSDKQSTPYGQIDMELRVYVYGNPSYGSPVTIDVDIISFPAVGDGGYGLFYFPELFATDTVLIDGVTEEVIRITEGSRAWSVGSGVWQLPPGNISSKVSFRTLYGDNEFDITDEDFVTVKIWPQTTGLIGTI